MADTGLRATAPAAHQDDGPEPMMADLPSTSLQLAQQLARAPAEPPRPALRRPLPSPELEAVMGRLRSIAKTLQPSLYRRLPPGQLEVLQQEVGIRVLDWAQVNSQKGPYGAVARSLLTTGPLSRMVQSRAEVLGHVAPRSTLPKVSKGVKGKSNPAGRTYTSRFRGVHQTFPTRRWEAQFRRNGKPTSLGCFDLEEEAARAYDKMMLWCELHNNTGMKGGITNYEPAEYEKDLGWLQAVSQDELIDALRSEGRRQAAHRMLRHKRDGPASGSPTPEHSQEGGFAAGTAGGGFGRAAGGGGGVEDDDAERLQSPAAAAAGEGQSQPQQAAGLPSAIEQVMAVIMGVSSASAAPPPLQPHLMAAAAAGNLPPVQQQQAQLTSRTAEAGNESSPQH